MIVKLVYGKVLPFHSLQLAAEYDESRWGSAVMGIFLRDIVRSSNGD